MRIKEIFEELGSDFLSLLIQTFNQIDDLVFVMSYNGKDYEYVYANQAAKDTVNLPSTLRHVSLESIVSEDAYGNLRAHYDKARTTLEKVRYVAPIEHRGKQIIGESLLTPIYMEKHNLHFILAIVRDITDHEQALRDLQAAQKQLDDERLRLESLIEYNNEAIFQVDNEGRIVKCNPEAKEFLNSTSSEIQNTLLAEWFQETFFTEWFSDSHFPQQSARHELWVTRKNTSDRQYIKLKFIPIYVENNQQGWYALLSDATIETNLQNELQRMAFIDHLSGLPNRRAFDDKLDYLLQQTVGTTERLAVFLLDGYKFKSINDTYGHDAGDAVIKEAASRIQRVLRDNDLVARFGGDEFAVLVPQIKSNEVIHEVANRILAEFKQPFIYKNKEIQIKLGIGASAFPGTALNKNQLLKEADHALYEIKEKSGVGFQLFTK